MFSGSLPVSHVSGHAIKAPAVTTPLSLITGPPQIWICVAGVCHRFGVPVRAGVELALVWDMAEENDLQDTGRRFFIDLASKPSPADEQSFPSSAVTRKVWECEIEAQTITVCKWYLSTW